MEVLICPFTEVLICPFTTSFIFYIQVELVSSLKSPRDVPKVNDAEWAGSDRPVLACADGCVRIMDILLRQGCSPIEEHQITGKT